MDLPLDKLLPKPALYALLGATVVIGLYEGARVVAAGVASENVTPLAAKVDQIGEALDEHKVDHAAERKILFKKLDDLTATINDVNSNVSYIHGVIGKSEEDSTYVGPRHKRMATTAVASPTGGP